eukprot:gb/GECG01014047.1/.p1 GENE.gb/GECG01014047.1/~~gb/GECG01014047.1/.p1  ORF type:complete len:141 (+),score=10.14 gb/GECG01014047.1/:1-423(+)
MTKWRQTALLLLILPAQLSCVKAGNNDIRGILQPHKPLQNEEITLGSSCIYKLGHLSPETVYSVRISYPSSEPTLFEIEPIELATSPGDRRQKRNQFQAGKRGLRDTAISESNFVEIMNVSGFDIFLGTQLGLRLANMVR